MSTLDLILPDNFLTNFAVESVDGFVNDIKITSVELKEWVGEIQIFEKPPLYVKFDNCKPIPIADTFECHQLNDDGICKYYTPEDELFDNVICEYKPTLHLEQQNSSIPMVIELLDENGKIISTYTVNAEHETLVLDTMIQ